jgi:DNA polymerase-4
MGRWVLHVDMDQFIAAVELLRRPELRGRPVVVGGDGDPTKRGVVATASYEARAHGVHSGLPMRTALRRCPDAAFLPADRDAYDAASALVMAALRGLPGGVVEVLGWDEAFVGIETDDPEATAHEIRRRVLAATELSCSVGIGLNKLQAKLATEFGKPGGVYRITDESWFPLFGERSPDALWGIGSRTAKRLASLGITTVNQLAAADPEVLAKEIGPSTGPWLISIGRGRSASVVSDEPWIAKGRSTETTYQTDIQDWEEVRREVVRLARQLTADIAAAGRSAVLVGVKVRFIPFTTRTRQRKLAAATTDPDVVAAAALVALDRFTSRRAVRLLGVRLEFAPLVDGGDGLDLDEQVGPEQAGDLDE